jgi:hypothetical protein
MRRYEPPRGVIDGTRGTRQENILDTYLQWFANPAEETVSHHGKVLFLGALREPGLLPKIADRMENLVAGADAIIRDRAQAVLEQLEIARLTHLAMADLERQDELMGRGDREGDLFEEGVAWAKKEALFWLKGQSSVP